MNKIWNKLTVVAALAAAFIAFCAAPAHASFIIRATEYNSSGTAVSTSSSGVISGSSGLLNTSLTDFTVTLVTNIVTTGGGSTAHSTTINLTYNGPTGVGNSDQLLVEVLGTGYSSPSSGTPSISSDASSANSGALAINSVTMTSGVISGAASLNTVTTGTTTLAGTLLGSQLGMTSGTGAMVAGQSALLTPDPANGSSFSIPNPFSFYQTYQFTSVTTAGTGGVAAGSTLSAVPEPASCLLALTSLPTLGLFGWLRRRKATQSN